MTIYVAKSIKKAKEIPGSPDSTCIFYFKVCMYAYFLESRLKIGMHRRLMPWAQVHLDVLDFHCVISIFEPQKFDFSNALTATGLRVRWCYKRPRVSHPCRPFDVSFLVFHLKLNDHVNNDGCEYDFKIRRVHESFMNITLRGNHCALNSQIHLYRFNTRQWQDNETVHLLTASLHKPVHCSTVIS